MGNSVLNYFSDGTMKYDMGLIDGMYEERERILDLLTPYTYCRGNDWCADGCQCFLVPNFLIDRIKDDGE